MNSKNKAADVSHKKPIDIHQVKAESRCLHHHQRGKITLLGNGCCLRRGKNHREVVEVKHSENDEDGKVPDSSRYASSASEIPEDKIRDEYKNEVSLLLYKARRK